MPLGATRLDEAILQRRLWTPALLPARLSFWFDAQDRPSIVNSAGNLQTWKDKAKTAGDVTNSTPAAGLVFAENKFNGFSMLNVSTQQQMQWAAALGVSDVTYYAFLQVTANALDHPVLTCGTSNGGIFWGCGSGNTWLVNKYATSTFVSTPMAGTDFYVMSSRTNQPTNTHVLRKNGVQTSATPAAVSLTGGTQYLFNDPGGSDWYLGLCGEILGFNGKHTDREMALVEGYLAWKWRVQHKLAGSHPYARRPPLIGT
jgi:hypothetical protein